MSVMYKNGSSWSNLMLQAYPVGAIYISYDSTSPADLFGGSWVAMTGRFPYFNTDTSVGGSNTVSHSHGLTQAYAQTVVNLNGTIGIGRKVSPSWTVNFHSVNNTPGTSSGWNSTYAAGLMGTTDTSNDSNMPAYQSLYAWRRTA